MTARTSVSRITSIARCGTAYELERILRLPALPAAWLAQGTAIHEAANRWEQSGRTMTIPEAQEIFKATWAAEIAKADAIEPDRDRWLVGGRKKAATDLRDRYDGGFEQIANYITYNLSDTRLQPYLMPDGSVAAEVGFEIEFQGIAVRGYIDIIMQDTVTGEPLIRDIKSGAKAPAVPFQLIVYRKAMQEILGIDVTWGDFFMTRDAQPTRAIDLTTLDNEWIERWFVRQVEIERQRLFLPNPGDACRTCGVAPHCPARTDMEGDLHAFHAQALDLYIEVRNELAAQGVPRKKAREAARAFLLNSQPVGMVVTGNMRAWREVLSKRLHEAADAEIQELADKILTHLKQVAPGSFQDLNGLITNAALRRAA